MTQMRSLVLLSCLLTALVGVPAAVAQPMSDDMALDDKIARAHFEAGNGHYKAGRFTEAGEEFRKAYGLSKRPELLYNTYVAYRDAGQDEPAADALRQYLAEMKNAPDRVNLEARLRSLDERVAAKKAEEERIAAAEAAAAQAAAPEATPAAEPVAVVSDDDDGGGAGVGPWILMGVGTAAILTGVVTGLTASGSYSDIEDACPQNVCADDFDLQGETDSVNTLAMVTNVLLIGGAVVAGGGLLWYLLADGDSSADTAEAKAARATASNVTFGGGCTTDGCMGSVKVGF